MSQVRWQQLWFPLVLLLLVQSVQVWRNADMLATHSLHDTDTYMRLVRVEELANTWDWFDSTIDRANTPYGDTLHWTRPFDVLLLAGAAPLVPFMGLKSALYWWGAAISPVLYLLFVVAIVWAGAPLVSDRFRAYLGALAIAQPVLFVYFLPARPDHHSLIAVLFALLFGSFLRLVSGQASHRQSILAGVVAAVGIWVSVEFIVAVAVLSLALLGAWIGRLRGAASHGLVFTAVSLAGITCALLLERGAASLSPLELDRLSIAHVAMLCAGTAFWFSIWTVERTGVAGTGLPRRGLSAALVGLAALLLLYLVLPGALHGPTADVDPRVMALWFSHVQEVQPALNAAQPYYNIGFALTVVGPALVAAPLVFFRLRQATEMYWLWFVVALALAAYGALALYQVRWATYVEAVALIPYAALLGRVLDWIAERFDARRLSTRLAAALLRSQAVVLFASVFLVLPLIFKPASSASEAANVLQDQCKLTRVLDQLDAAAGTGRGPGASVLTSLFSGPELLYRTQHAVVGTPYHRNARGMLDSIDFFTAVDDAAAADIVRRRRIDLVLVCAAKGGGSLYRQIEGVDDRALYYRLAEGHPPDWLQPVRLSEPASAFRLYRVATRSQAQ